MPALSANFRLLAARTLVAAGEVRAWFVTKLAGKLPPCRRWTSPRFGRSESVERFNKGLADGLYISGIAATRRLWARAR
jgi:hypothetical protein